MISQFSDIDGPKRDGINTFHVQHGTYPNQEMKHEFHNRTKNKLSSLSLKISVLIESY